MDTKTLTDFRVRLEQERERLEAEVERISREGYETLSEASGENNYRDHMADQGSATFAREMDMTLDENHRTALADVVNALSRVENGQYGVCECCAQPISIERLKAIPTASMCIECKVAEECP